MSITSADIVLLYSGGTDNYDPSLSLGGQASAYPITGSLNNLFDDISAPQAVSGLSDYRCFFVANRHPTSTFYGVTASIGQQVAEGSTAVIGFQTQEEVQAVTIRGNCTSGSLTLAYNSAAFTFAFDTTPSVLASNMQTSINTLLGSADVTVRGMVDNTALTLIADFGGHRANTAQPLLILVSNDVVGSTGVSILRLQPGLPINSIPPLLMSETQPPPGVTFMNPSESLMVGDLGPGDTLPVWIMRSTPPNAPGMRMDGCQFQLTGSPIP